MNFQVWLAGSLAAHRRGRILRDLLGAQTLEGGPGATGVSLLFGLEFQNAGPDERDRWLALPDAPGRTLLLIPPLKLGPASLPSAWSVAELSEGARAEAGSVPALLAPEVRHRIAGVLQVPQRPAGRWEDGAIHTGYHRRHPHAGIFSVTCLPLWSAALLGHRAELATWLAELHTLAGSAAPVRPESGPGPVLTSDHYAVLLHLCRGHFADRSDALGHLASSPVFALEADRAGACYDDLERQGLVFRARPSDTGLAILRDGPYAAYFEAIQEEK